jgi:hypothetical protein
MQLAMAICERAIALVVRRQEPTKGPVMRSLAHTMRLRTYAPALALVLGACSAPGGSEHAQLGSEQAAVTGTTGTMLLEEESIFFVQRMPLSNIVGAVTLSNGEQLDVLAAANTALARHQELEAQVASGSGLLAPATTLKEFVETPDTVIITARTEMVVVDPVALGRASPIIAGLAFKGASARPYAVLSAEEMTWLRELRTEMLLKPATHPLKGPARQGLESLWNAVAAGKGDLRITTTIEVPIGGLPRDGGSVMAPAFDGGSFDYESLSPIAISGFNAPVFESAPDLGSTIEDGKVTTRSAFVNGFMEDDAWEFKEHWNFSLGSFTFKAGAWYRFGVRVPIKVTGKMSPTDIRHEAVEPDVDSWFETELSVDVIDAGEDHYAAAGLPPSELHQGHELVAGGGAYVTLKLNLPGGLFDIDRTIPHNRGFDWGQDFQPPFGNCGTDCGFNFWVPPSFTNTRFDVLGIIGGEVKLGFNVAGDGEVDFAYESLYDHESTRSTRDGGASKRLHRLSFTAPGDESFETKLAALTEHGNKSFGYRLSDFDYDWAVKLTPAVTSNVFIHCALLDWTQNLGTLYFDFASFGVGTVSFAALEGTHEQREVEEGLKSWSPLAGSVDGQHVSDLLPEGPVMPARPDQHDAGGPPNGPDEGAPTGDGESIDEEEPLP